MSQAANLPPGVTPGRRVMSVSEFQESFGTLRGSVVGSPSAPVAAPASTQPVANGSPFAARSEEISSAPSKRISIPVSAWAEGWANAPTEPIVVGFRSPSEEDLSLARAEAARKAWALHDNPSDEDARIECYNGVLMVNVLAAGLCDPDDAKKHRWTGAEAVIAEGLKSESIEWLFTELDIFMGANSPTAPEATDEEVHELAEGLLSGDAWRGISGRAGHRVRRLLRAVIDELASDHVEIEGDS